MLHILNNMEWKPGSSHTWAIWQLKPAWYSISWDRSMLPFKRITACSFSGPAQDPKSSRGCSVADSQIFHPKVVAVLDKS
jgi:hypothetical protein